jgi:hypothetical protein
MSTDVRKGAGRPELRSQRPCEPGDEQDGAWTRDMVVAMDTRFVERVARVLEHDKQTATDLIKRAK